MDGLVELHSAHTHAHTLAHTHTHTHAHTLTRVPRVDPTAPQGR